MIKLVWKEKQNTKLKAVSHLKKENIQESFTKLFELASNSFDDQRKYSTKNGTVRGKRSYKIKCLNASIKFEESISMSMFYNFGSNCSSPSILNYTAFFVSVHAQPVNAFLGLSSQNKSCTL